MKSVYLMKSSHDLYKVGVARNPERRLKELQTSNGSKVLLVTHASAGNAWELEKQIHTMLDKHRQSGGREWFELTPEQALKVCIFIHQKAARYDDENEIQKMVAEYATIHESLVNARRELETITTQIGSEIQKATARLHRYKPIPKNPKSPTKQKPESESDEALYRKAVNYVRDLGKASTSMLQREFKIGYGRAARIISDMESRGLISKADGPRPRVVLEPYKKAVAPVLTPPVV